MADNHAYVLSGATTNTELLRGGAVAPLVLETTLPVAEPEQRRQLRGISIAYAIDDLPSTERVSYGSKRSDVGRDDFVLGNKSDDAERGTALTFSKGRFHRPA